MRQIGKVMRIQKTARNGSSHCLEDHTVLTEHERLLWKESEELVSSSTKELAELHYVKHVMTPLLGPKHVDAGVCFFFFSFSFIIIIFLIKLMLFFGVCAVIIFRSCFFIICRGSFNVDIQRFHICMTFWIMFLVANERETVEAIFNIFPAQFEDN